MGVSSPLLDLNYFLLVCSSYSSFKSNFVKNKPPRPKCCPFMGGGIRTI
jgi:hypothetical protein